MDGQRITDYSHSVYKLDVISIYIFNPAHEILSSTNQLIA